jgi:CDP-4-dehydro-6-deoxyglucose reductase, E1
VPVFVDIELDTYNVDVDQLEEAYSDKTRAVMLAHTLGHPFNLDAVLAFCQKYNLWLIEDNCDALGSKYRGEYTGTFGDLATQSFFPAHHITTGQGGAVLTSNPLLAGIVRSFRDWGRTCWCSAGYDNACGKRYNWQLGDLPAGYDHKYVYSHIGYNLEMTDLQAAIGYAQMDRLQEFISVRRLNWSNLYSGLCDLGEFFALPHYMLETEPSWFGFALRVREHAPFSRLDVIQYLDEKKIDAKLLFAGNLTKQPAYKNIEFRISGKLNHTDDAMNNVFWIGVYPGLGEMEVNYMIEVLHDFARKY